MLIKDFCLYLSSLFDVSFEYTYLMILTIIFFSIVKIISFTLKRILRILDTKKNYIIYKKINLILTIFFILSMILIWNKYINDYITFISFVSATLTLALKDIIFNYFSGIYIRLKKPFNIDDRIELNNIKGDVIALNSLDFEILEIGDYIDSDQSTGKIINIPNSLALLTPIKNYNKNFRYIWNEIVVNTYLDANIEYIKGLLYEIINTNDLINQVPKKMKNCVVNNNYEERIYYNKLEPIIYIKVYNKYISFYVRYLVDSKKNRQIEDYFWNKVIKLYRSGSINLYVE